MFELIRPDTINEVGGLYRFTFAGGRNIDALPIGAEFTIIYSPSDTINNWHATRYRIAPTPSHLSSYMKVVIQRELEPNEITHFEALLAAQQATNGA